MGRFEVVCLGNEDWGLSLDIDVSISVDLRAERGSVQHYTGAIPLP